MAVHLIFLNSDNAHAITPGHTVRVTRDGCEQLS